MIACAAVADSDLESLFVRLDQAYASRSSFRLEISEHRAAASPEQPTGIGDRIGWCEVVCSMRGDTRIDLTHPMQKRALQCMNGTLLVSGKLFELSTMPRRAVARTVSPPHSAAMVARRAPIHIPAQVRAAVEGDAGATIESDIHRGTLLVNAPRQGYSFTFDASDLALLRVVSQRPNGRVTEYAVEEFHQDNPVFAARFPALARTTSRIARGTGEQAHVVLEVFTRPEPSAAPPDLFDWRQYASDLLDESNLSEQTRSPASTPPPSAAMAIDTRRALAEPDGPVMPRDLLGVERYLLVLGIALVIGGGAWALRRRIA